MEDFQEKMKEGLAQLQAKVAQLDEKEDRLNTDLKRRMRQLDQKEDMISQEISQVERLYQRVLLSHGISLRDLQS